ncbi:MAG: DUF1800 family protein [Saprospiraceae bacterium]|nr:DUF1800 family protein [Saprospiraceae bacterium]
MLRNRVLRSRSKSLYSWTVLQMHYSGISIREKLTLFWHNHFVVADATIAHREYLYYSIIPIIPKMTSFKWQKYSQDGECCR